MDKILLKIKRLIPKNIFTILQPAYHFLLSWLAAVIYRWPSEKLIVIGITGTTGKTTSVYLIAKTLEEAGFKIGFTSTAILNDGKKEWLNDKKMTMLGRFFTQMMLSRMVKNKCQYAIVETTSEGIKQFRHRFINYDIIIFTGLYSEHLEAHGGFLNYKEAKGKLFAHLKKCKTKYADENKYIIKRISGFKKLGLNRVKKTIIANLDNKHAGYFLDFWAEEKIGFTNIDIADSSGLKANIANENIQIIKYGGVEVSSAGVNFKINKINFQLQLLGGFNAANAMTAVCASLTQGLSWEQIKKALGNIKGVAGRLEKINEGQPFTVIIDYAFEPNAVNKLYEAIKVIPHKKTIHVLGACGGGRDAVKRPLLGKIAGENSNIVIITNEDPYDDDPQIIIDQVAIGAEHVGKIPTVNLFKIQDRREAIEKALALAEEEDMVLITGKGSEQAICVAGGERVPWDDRAVVRGILENRQ
jgi:UDP-N-acetylmuramoyl-L-alanyl-D-glutamate--2,6-diaminopimelate ligase